MNKLFILCSFILVQCFILGQTAVSLEEAYALSLRNNPQMLLSHQKVEREKSLLKSTFNLNNLDIIFEAPTGLQQRPGIMQFIDFPTVYAKQYQTQKASIDVAKSESSINEKLLKLNVRLVYNQLLFLNAKRDFLRRYDSVYVQLSDANALKYKVGEITQLEKLTGQAKYKLINNQLLQVESELKGIQVLFSNYLNPDDVTDIYTVKGVLAVIDTNIIKDFQGNEVTEGPFFSFYGNRIRRSELALKTERSRMLPGLFVGYLNQVDFNTRTYYKLRFGVSLPIWFWTYSSRIKVAKQDLEITKTESLINKRRLNAEYAAIWSQLLQQWHNIRYYQSTGLQQNDEIIRHARASFSAGNIGYYEYLMNIDQSYQVISNYLENLKNYNQSVINLLYLKGEI